MGGDGTLVGIGGTLVRVDADCGPPYRSLVRTLMYAWGNARMARVTVGLAPVVAGIGALIGGLALSWSGALAQSAAQPATPIRKADVTLTILEVRSNDAKTPADLFARVTIAGDTTLSRIAPKPSLRVTMPASEPIPVRIELFDRRPPTYADQIDINQIAGKRDLDFVVDPATCTVTGFSQTYKCTDVITRNGLDLKPGTISFRIDVVR